jgi:hypothetical protein
MTPAQRDRTADRGGAGHVIHKIMVRAGLSPYAARQEQPGDPVPRQRGGAMATPGRKVVTPG